VDVETKEVTDSVDEHSEEDDSDGDDEDDDGATVDAEVREKIKSALGVAASHSDAEVTDISHLFYKCTHSVHVRKRFTYVASQTGPPFSLGVSRPNPYAQTLT